jgi:hypothetical protein
MYSRLLRIPASKVLLGSRALHDSAFLQKLVPFNLPDIGEGIAEVRGYSALLLTWIEDDVFAIRFVLLLATAPLYDFPVVRINRRHSPHVTLWPCI